MYGKNGDGIKGKENKIKVRKVGDNVERGNEET